MSAAAGGDVPPECVDQPELANCELIVYARLCSNSYYSSFCCASCTRHSRGNDRLGRLGWRWERRQEVRAFCLKHWSRFGGLGFKKTKTKHKRNTSNPELLPQPKSTSPECRDKKADDCCGAGVDRLGHVQGLCVYTAAGNTEYGNIKQGLKVKPMMWWTNLLFLPTCLK